MSWGYGSGVSRGSLNVQAVGDFCVTLHFEAGSRVVDQTL